jgi:hypothetical protein
VNQFLWGACAAAAAIAALFFCRFWRQTRDRLFAMFALAFLALATNWTMLGLLDPKSESRNAAYIFRLVAFGLIVAAVIGKNRGAQRKR